MGDIAQTQDAPSVPIGAARVDIPFRWVSAPSDRARNARRLGAWAREGGSGL